MGNILPANFNSSSFGAPFGGGGPNYTGAPVQVGNQMQGNGMGHVGPTQSILQPVTTPAQGPGGGSNSPPNYAYLGHPSQGSGQAAPTTGASPTMGSK